MVSQDVTPRTMRTPALATVYLDNEAIGLMGDLRPRVSKIIAAGGKKPEFVNVLRAQSPDDRHGKPVRLEETIDRTVEPAKAIYLTSSPKSTTPVVVTRKAPARAVSRPVAPPQSSEWATWPPTDDEAKRSAAPAKDSGKSGGTREPATDRVRRGKRSADDSVAWDL